MTTLFEQQGGQYEMQGDYRLPCVALPQDTNEHIGVWGERHRRYLKVNHRIRYYNLCKCQFKNVQKVENKNVHLFRTNPQIPCLP